jgi:hypothetical protein
MTARTRGRRFIALQGAERIVFDTVEDPIVSHDLQDIVPDDA